jgi:hypothetical protein
MAKTMTFAVGGKEFTVEPVKIERKKLYGWSEIHAFDDDGNECALVSTDSSGTIIIPKGGIDLGMLSEDGKYIERGRLKTVNADGSDAVLVKSSYSVVNTLKEKASNEELLDCSIKAFYHLADADSAFISAVGDDIYKFNYCFRDSYETAQAFLLTSEIGGKKELFMFVGTKGNFEFVGLNQIAIADEFEVEEEEEEESDDIDFSMF